MAQKDVGKYFNVYGGVDDWLDCPNDDFRMSTWFTEGEDDPSIVWHIGHELVSLFNGAGCLLQRNFNKVTIVSVVRDGQAINHLPTKSPVGLMGRPAKHEREIQKSYKAANKVDTRLALLHHATEHEDAYMILKYLDMPGDWNTYYKLMETIESHAKKNAIELSTDDKRRTAFTNTANNFALSSFDARHGFKEQLKKNNSPTLSIEEGYEFASKMAKIYLKHRYFTVENSTP